MGAPCVVLFSAESDPERVCPRGRGGVLAITARSLEVLDLAPVEQAIGNVGGFLQRASA